MIHELTTIEASAIIGGRQEAEVEFPNGGWAINCTSSGVDYYRIYAGTSVTQSGQVVSGGIQPVSEGYYANQEYRAGERDLEYFPVTVSRGC